jgi:hypothetical protein
MQEPIRIGPPGSLRPLTVTPETLLTESQLDDRNVRPTELLARPQEEPTECSRDSLREPAR